MLDSLTHENVRDFAQRYQGTCGWLLNEQAKTLVYIRKVENDKVTFQDVTGRNFFAFVEGKVQFEFLPVTRGWFYDKDKQMILLFRRPARQWQRGISANNTGAYWASDGRLRIASVNINLIDDIFNYEGNSRYQYNGGNCILSKQFARFQNYLYLYDRNIGTFVGDKLNLAKFGEILRQEVMDVINRNNYRIELQ